MKFQKIKYMLSGAIISAMVFNVIPSAYAKVSQMNIPVTYKNIKILVDGKQVSTDKEPFIYDGTTYLPVRAVGEAVGKTVTWDSNTNTVKLSSSSTDETKSTTTSYSRTNPAPVGTEQTYTYKSKYDTDYSVKIKITDSYRGTTAWNMIKEENMFNEPAPEGKEYIVVKIKADVLSVENDEAVDFSTYDFTPFSKSGTEYEQPIMLVDPSPVFSGAVYKGSSLEGYAAFLVDKSDDSPRVVYGEDYNGAGGVWFKITK